MRTIVLRVSQRANSRAITVEAHLAVDGHMIPNAIMKAATATSGGGMLDQAAMGMLVRAVKSTASSWPERLPSGDLA